MTANEPLYLVPETLLRIGNATSPLLTRVRAHEIDLVELNGVQVIVANDKGVSLYTKAGLELTGLSGWVWELPAASPLPFGLKLALKEPPPGHYHLCPINNMPLREYIDRLEEVQMKCAKVYRKQA